VASLRQVATDTQTGESLVLLWWWSKPET
jgi:hypothetical protein